MRNMVAEEVARMANPRKQINSLIRQYEGQRDKANEALDHLRALLEIAETMPKVRPETPRTKYGKKPAKHYVLELLKETKGALTVPQIRDSLGAQGKSYTRPSIDNALDSLIDSAQVVKVDAEDDPRSKWAFEFKRLQVAK